MKRVLAVAFAVAILSLAFNASAQVPFVQVYFDEYGTVANDSCPPCGPEQVDKLSVFAVNFNMDMIAIEYLIQLPAALSFIGDEMEECNLSIGSSSVTPPGIAISMPCLANAWQPVRTQKINVWWNCCDDCSGYQNSAVVVLPHGDSGQVRAVSWPDYNVVNGVGMTSMICQTPVAAKESTWGEIKSLYNQ